WERRWSSSIFVPYLREVSARFSDKSHKTRDLKGWQDTCSIECRTESCHVNTFAGYFQKRHTRKSCLDSLRGRPGDGAATFEPISLSASRGLFRIRSKNQPNRCQRDSVSFRRDQLGMLEHVMVTEVAFAGVVVVFLGLALSAYVINMIDGKRGRRSRCT